MSFEIVCKFILKKLHEFYKFCKKCSRFPLPRTIWAKANSITSHIQISLKKNFELVNYNNHNYIVNYTKLKMT
jgi:hypothetical protein